MEETAAPVPEAAASVEMEEEEEDPELLEAMRLSMETSSAPVESSSGAATGGFLDAEFVKQLLGGVDVDPNDPLIQAALAQMGAAQQEDDANDAKRRKSDDDKPAK